MGDPESTTTLARIDVRSPFFGLNFPIPARHAHGAENLSPPVRWTRVPANTRTFALLREDSDAAGADPFVHWLIYDIPGRLNELPEGLHDPKPEEVPGSSQGVNDFGEIGYGGPEPPAGSGAHRYVFRLYAVDRVLRLQPGTRSGTCSTP